MKNKFIYLIICIAIFLFIYVLFQYRKINTLEYDNSRMVINTDNTKRVFKTIINSFDNFILYDNQRIKDVKLIDGDGNSIMLSDIVEEEKMIIFLPIINCHTCSAKEIDVLKKIIKPTVRERICILARFRNKRELKIFEKSTGLKTFDLLPESKLFLKQTLNDRPVLFILSPYLYGHCFFLSDNENYKLSEEYYKMIQKRFEN